MQVNIFLESIRWCRMGDLNTRPPHYECDALPAELMRLYWIGFSIVLLAIAIPDSLKELEGLFLVAFLAHTGVIRATF